MEELSYARACVANHVCRKCGERVGINLYRIGTHMYRWADAGGENKFVDTTILPAVSRIFTVHRNGRREISNRLGLRAANTLFLRSDRRGSVVCWLDPQLHRATCFFGFIRLLPYRSRHLGGRTRRVSTKRRAVERRSSVENALARDKSRETFESATR